MKALPFHGIHPLQFFTRVKFFDSLDYKIGSMLIGVGMGWNIFTKYC
jgi:hypothetical protein